MRIPFGNDIIGDCVIRDLEDGDKPALVEHANNPAVAAQLRDRFPHPYTLADAEAWMDHVAAQDPRTSFCIATGDGLVGTIGLTLQEDILRRSAEVGLWLGEAVWGRGLGTRAVDAFSAAAMERFDLLRLYAHVFANNPASARVFEKAGYQQEGRLRQAAVKKGEVLDLLLYARVRP